MTITVSARDLFNKGLWEDFCDLTGTNPWCIAEGLGDSDTTFSLEEDEARKLGLLN
jgi:hypothetical protein